MAGGCVHLILAVLICQSVYSASTRRKNDHQNDHQKVAMGGRANRTRMIRSAILRDEKYRWDKGVVPFTLTDSLDEDNIHEIKRAMATYERYTCIRFSPWTSATNADLGLGHDGHLNFVKGDSCNADLGNKRSSDGQYISCCDDTKCIHEIGHALGFVHEHQSPEREGWIIVNYDNIKKDWRQWYEEYDENDVITDGFDIQSIMAYPPDANSDSGDSYTVLDYELTWGDDFFYLFKQIANEYKCAETQECAGSTMTCDNDGFLTVVEGKCACLCPKGLDPATGCKDIMKVAPVTEFPGGQWALPMTTSGCPDDTFKTGYLKHFTDTDGDNEKSTSYHLKGTIDGTSAEHYFCVHSGDSSQPYWGDGNYCTYQLGGECPLARAEGEQGADFKGGYISVYDKKSTDYQDPTGDVSDGQFTNKLTEFTFCCRDSGFTNLPIYLPNQQPLALFMPQYTFECQEIFGMHSTEEYVGLNSLNYREATYYDETPFMKADGARRLYIKHCYYVPAVTDCGAMIKLDETNPSASFSSPTGDQLDCHWHISAPEGTRIKLEFEDMNVSGTMPWDCQDYVDVRHVLMGQAGNQFCGTEDLPSVISYYNSMMIHFVTYEGSSSSFSATLSIIKDEDFCYSLADQGLSYAGVTSHTKAWSECIPWTEATSCRHHAFDTEDIGKGLDRNFCRNPDDSLAPWCYTDPVYCERDYCDACLLGSPIDTDENCQQFKADGNCESDILASEKCAKTCQDSITKRDPVPLSQVSCPFPPPLPDGTLTEAVKESYKVGEAVKYNCNAEGSTSSVTRTCLSTGIWSPAAYACFTCEPGWTVFRGHCFLYHDQREYYGDADWICSEAGGYLANAKNKELNEFLLGLTLKGSTWLGGKNPMDGDDWLWSDGAAVSWSNWKSGYPELDFFPEQCLLMAANGEWTDGICDGKSNRFICEKDPGFDPVCADFLSTCAELMAARPSMCTDFPDFSANSCAVSCNLCQTDSECDMVAPTSNAQFVHKSYSTRKTVPQGTELYFSCLPNTKQKSGDTVRTCQAGQFSGSELVCAKECPVPSPTENAEFVGDVTDSVEEGTEVRYQCKGEAKQASGDYVRTCQQDGQLSGSGLLCEKIAECPVSSPTENAEFVGDVTDSVEEGSEVRYQCKGEAKQASGDSVRTCQHDGQLSGTDLVCEEIEVAPVVCQLPPVKYPVKQMKPSAPESQLSRGSTVYYWCYPPYLVVSGAATRICQADGTLSGEHPVCGL